jgi:hypothetical protein
VNYKTAPIFPNHHRLALGAKVKQVSNGVITNYTKLSKERKNTAFTANL